MQTITGDEFVLCLRWRAAEIDVVAVTNRQTVTIGPGLREGADATAVPAVQWLRFEVLLGYRSLRSCPRDDFRRMVIFKPAIRVDNFRAKIILDDKSDRGRGIMQHVRCSSNHSYRDNRGEYPRQAHVAQLLLRWPFSLPRISHKVALALFN